MGGEAQNPRFSMGHATKLVPYRVIFVYMVCVIFITLLIPSNNDQLLGGSGITASPLVLSIQLVGIPFGLVHPVGRHPLRIVYFECWYHVRYSCHLRRVDLSILQNLEDDGPPKAHSGMGRAG